MATSSMKIIYTYTDEAPALRTHSLLPIIQATATRRASASRPRHLARRRASWRRSDWPDDHLAELGELAKTPDANIIKLPNISASVPQLKAAVKELQAAGFDLPDYPESPQTDDEKRAREKYDTVKGSAVNPVLREGNSDRRAPASVKNYVKTHPHSMGAWDPGTKSHVATMSDGDFRHSETSVTVPEATTLRIEHVGQDGTTTVLKDGLRVLAGEVVDAAVMRKQALEEFLAREIADARAQGVLFSVHLKATMMKVSDPIIFGHAVRAYFADVFEQLRRRPRLGRRRPEPGARRGAERPGELPADKRAEVEAAITKAYETGRRWPRSTPAAASPTCTCRATSSSTPRCPRRSAPPGRCGTPTTSSRTPSSSSPTLLRRPLRGDGAALQGARRLRPHAMGTVPNVGLMAQKAEEYGSHDKTFEIPAAGTVRVVDDKGAVLLEQAVAEGDIFRACQTKDAPIKDWVQLAVRRAGPPVRRRSSGSTSSAPTTPRC
jgi:isocitrate dehydrogenase